QAAWHLFLWGMVCRMPVAVLIGCCVHFDRNQNQRDRSFVEVAMLELLRHRKPSSSSLQSLHRRRRARLRVEELEARCLLSLFAPAQIRRAYGFDQISFTADGQTIAGDGAGQTIAIVDAFDAPNIVSDLQQFDSAFNLPDPTFTKSSPT